MTPTLLSLSYGQLKRKDPSAFDGLRPASYSTYQMLYPGDVVLRLLDLQNDKRSVRVGQVTEPGIITSAYVGLDCSWWGSARYAYYLLLALDILKVFYGLGSGMRQSITFSDLGRVPIAIPSHQEQRAIASFLDIETVRIDALIEAKKILLSALEQLKNSRLTQILTGAELASVESGDQWLPKIPRGWNLVRLKFLGQIRSGVAKGKKYGGTSMVEVPYLRVANVQDGYLDLSSVSLIEVSDDEVERYALRPGDVLMNEGGDYDKVGRGAMWSGEVSPCIHQNHVFAVRLDDATIAPWLAAITRTAYAKFYFMNNAKQSTNLASISQGNVKEFPVLLPPEAERGRLLKSLNDELLRLSDLAEHARKEIDLLTELRSTTITDAVLGRIDLRHNFQSKKELEAA
ncbi:restriction endonuclease subunit S [Variovorax sp. 770b2]|uniref:restriction endonuclease subunit S n=1 Tax=Variovorax sp. 770b2 TaxID=1566271 RepID=UPI0015A57268|nr:restriction endonuclease subunit S [Variovorax sp. 770b2]